MHQHFLALSFAFLAPQAALAVTFQQHAENLLYFEHASAGTAYCEGRGIPVRTAYESWRRKNEPVYRDAVTAVRERAASGGMMGAEQDRMVAQSIDIQRRKAEENVAAKGVPCGRFREVLETYDTLFKR